MFFSWEWRMADGGWRKLNLTSGTPYLRRSICDALPATSYLRRPICDALRAWSVRLDSRRFRHLAPQRVVGANQLFQLFRRAGRGRHAERANALLHVGHVEYAHERLIQPADDGARRPGGRDHSVPLDYVAELLVAHLHC